MQNQSTLNTEAPNTHTLIGRLLHYAETTPDHDAVVTPIFSLTYYQLATNVMAQASALKALGVSHTSTVGIHCNDDTQHLVLTLAATYLGATSCTIPSYENLEARQAIQAYCDVTHVLDKSIAIDLEQSPDNIDFTYNQAPASCLLFSTSGSTGKPKLVMHHDTDLVAQAHRHVGSPSERFTCRASMEHNFAKRHRLYCLAVGATNVFLNGELENVVEDCLKLAVNVMHVSAFQAQELLDLPNIKQLAHIKLKLGGSHVPETLRKALRTNITSTLQAGYGTTETGAIAFTDPDDLNASESVGQALPGIEIRCVDADRNPVQQGKRGEVAIRCKGMFRGYYKQAEITTQRLENDWFYTGDTAYLDTQQRIHLCGRSDDMFTFNSMNIYPQEIESVIRQFPDVMNAVVLPKPSSTHGNIPIALVEFNPTMRPHVSALKKFVEKQVGTRSPRQYIFVDKIPTNAAGKVSRIAASTLTEKSDQMRQALIDLLDEQWKDHVKPPLVKDFIDGKRDLSFRKLQMDSLARMNLLVAIEVNYDIIISPQELVRLRTLGKLASRIINSTDKIRNTDTPNNQQIAFENIQLQAGERPYIVRLFKRFAQYCDTATQLNQIFSDLEYRLTPLDVAHIDLAHSKTALIDNPKKEKLNQAVSDWLAETKTLMFKSGNKTPEPFVFKRLTREITLFSNGNNTQQKTLIIGFTPRDAPHMMVPNSVLLQHIDAKKYDLLMIAGVNRHNYGFGKLPFGKKLKQLSQALHQHININAYQEVRTLGFSSGGFPAIVIGHLLDAKVALSIGGRFHKRKYVMANLDMILSIRNAYKTGLCNRTIASYSANNKRDQKFAKLLHKICHAEKVAVEIKNENLPHLPLRRLIERGELRAYLAKTLFAETNH